MTLLRKPDVPFGHRSPLEVSGAIGFITRLPYVRYEAFEKKSIYLPANHFKKHVITYVVAMYKKSISAVLALLYLHVWVSSGALVRTEQPESSRRKISK